MYDVLGTDLGDIASVVFGDVPNIPPIDSMWCTGESFDQGFIDNDLCTAGGHIFMFQSKVSKASKVLKVSLSCTSADSWGLIFDGGRIFRVVVHWLTILSQRCRGEFGLVMMIPATSIP